MGKELNSSGLGIDLGPLNISCLCFADDLVIIGRSRSSLDALMTKTRSFFLHHHLEISGTKSKIMSFDAQTGKTIFQDSTNSSPLLLDQVLSFKYLGVPLNCSPYHLFQCFNKQVQQRAQSFLSRVLSLVKSGPDRSNLAYTLWNSVALPSILYGAEAIPLTQGSINVIEKCQSAIGKFILQIPRSSACVSATIDAGFKPIKFVLAEKVILYSNSVMSKPASFWPKVAMTENINLGNKSPYTKYLLRLKSATGSFGLSRQQTLSSIRKAAITHTLDQQRLVSTTTFAMNAPRPLTSVNRWFKPKPWVSDSGLSKIFAQFRAANTGLGNRGPAKDGERYKLCPLCIQIGERALNNEVRTIIEKILTLTHPFLGAYVD